MTSKRKSPGRHAEAQIKKHSKKTTPRNAKTQASRVRVRLLFLALPANGEDTVQPDGEHLLALADVYAGGFLLMFCQVRQKPGQKAYVRLPQKEFTDSNTPFAIPWDKTLLKGVERIILNALEDSQSLRGEVHASSTFVVLSEPPFGEPWEAAL
jgi:hypothetical protein